MKNVNQFSFLCLLLLLSFSLNNNVHAVSVVPEAPTFSGGTIIGGTWIQIFWNAPFDGGSSITGYQVFVSNSSSSGYVLAGQPSVLTWNTTGLINGVTYYFKIAAFNDIGVGSNSTVFSATPVTVPDAPSITTATPGNTYVILTWNAPFDGGSSITGYQVFVSNSSDPSYVLAAQTTALTWNTTGLTNGVTYYFKIAAFNDIGVGPNSTVLSTALPTISSLDSTSSSETSTSSPTSSDVTSADDKENNSVIGYDPTTSFLGIFLMLTVMITILDRRSI